ncbi:MAG: hypothetical protein FWF85_05840 [Clostridiales bacterium]|nr:hypothetical protein [Clostridiales bacterium]
MATLIRKHWQMISVYSFTHFLVDFACAFLMFRSIAAAPDWYLYVLIYNFCAFALQMPLGILADRWNRNFLIAVIGCLLVGAAFGLGQVPLAAVLALGLGNALFHIGGGIDVLNISTEKMGALGIFVAPGALGIYFGTSLGKGDNFPAIVILLGLVVLAGLIIAMRRKKGKSYPQNAVFSLEIGNNYQLLIAAICLFLVVCLRSYVGLALNFPWKVIGNWGMILVCAVVFGKVAGGFAADSWGIKRTVFFSLAIAALLFLFPGIPPAGIGAVLLFNLTMPITLWLMAKIFPGAKGFSFGLLTFALFLGFLPLYLGLNIPGGAFCFFTLATIASLLLLGLGIRRIKL